MSRSKILTTGASATDTQALNGRIAAYAQFASKDVNIILEQEMAAWDHQADLEILDLGCGSGKQSLWLGEHFPNAKIRALDVSPVGLEQIRSQNPRIETLCGSYDDVELKPLILDRHYDVILSFFSLYYAQDFKSWLYSLKAALKPGGKLILVGYSALNNGEIVELSRECGGADCLSQDFISAQEIHDVFEGDVRLRHFANQMHFPSFETFAAYYRNYGLYDPKVEAHVQAEFAKGLRQDFQWTKDSLVLVYENHFKLDQLPGPWCERLDLREYQCFLQQALSMGYEIMPICAAKSESKPGKVLFLRHDVDLDLQCALKMAKLEAKLGVRSSYYILASGDYYHPFTAENRGIIAQIEALGHEIGLHYEGDLSESLALMNCILTHPVQSASQHNPTLNGVQPVDVDLLDAYDPSWIKRWGVEYISDSGKKWRRHHLNSALELDRIYVLLHPESWVWGESDIVEMIRAAESKALRQVRQNFSLFAQQNLVYHQNRQSLEAGE